MNQLPLKENYIIIKESRETPLNQIIAGKNDTTAKESHDTINNTKISAENQFDTKEYYETPVLQILSGQPITRDNIMKVRRKSLDKQTVPDALPEFVSNKNVKQDTKTKLLVAIENHISYQQALKKGSIKSKQRGPSAISSDQWRSFYLKKDEEKKSRRIKLRKINKRGRGHEKIKRKI